ncbi:copper chaperone CopZ [Flexistipes sp.]|uniref:copper chaperone CopZ n=1 Tax=Flexistipes sp. TaxID=3088135 RepID=UPI002E1C8DF5|nr:copper chaperone CopZ [Flexistipes sp.]
MKDVTIEVRGMTCGHCKMAVEGEINGLKGVDSAVVDLDAGNVKVSFDETSVTMDDIYDAIDEAGYEPVK